MPHRPISGIVSVGDTAADLTRQPRPLTCCSVCGTVGYSITLSDGPCGQQINGKPCRGTYQRALRGSDWVECPACNGSKTSPSRCIRCGGAGWLFVRLN